MSEQSCHLTVEDLTREIRLNGSPRTIVDHVSFCFERGLIYNILGPSGAGKSSLLRLINRLDDATAGRVLFEGRDTSAISPCELRLRIGFLFQSPHLFDGSIADNIRFARPDLSKGELLTVAAQVQIDREMLDSPVDNLSIGEKQRVALARLLATDPLVALLDEPTSALDPTRTEAIEKTIKDVVAKRRLTVLMVSHDPAQALRMGGQALLMVKGRLMEHGSVEQVVNNPRSDDGRRYRDRELT
jgi:putative ABC transport system ATP-binding protein